MKYIRVSWLFALTLLLLAACGSVQEQASSSVPRLAEGEDFHYVQLEQLSLAPEVAVTLTDALGETATVTARTGEAGELIYEGDMIVGQASDLSSQGHLGKNIELWYRALVPYTIDSNMPSAKRSAIYTAMRHITDKTNVAFVARTNQPNYVTFRPSSGCSSNVGKVGGRQFINIASYCDTSTVIHEIGHALGLKHEHSRSDRDTYIYMNCNLVDCGNSSSWGKSDGSRYGPYDYYSVMHYSAFFSGKQVIASKNPTVPSSKIGGYWLSKGDISALKKLYPYPAGSY
jgi:hypothetical protein